tara:strand:- start:1692 stop:2156 length:465 start_codon:yes stop_codon:yes gene_type:complete
MKSDSINKNSGAYGSLPRKVVLVPDAATYEIKAADSGIIHVCPDLTADIVISLPAEEQGLSYEFWYGGSLADAQDWQFDTGADVNYFIGGLVHNDTDGDVTNVVDSDGDSNSKVSVLTPIAGTMVKFVCNGQQWYLNGHVVSATNTAIVFADQS